MTPHVMIAVYHGVLRESCGEKQDCRHEKLVVYCPACLPA